MSSLAIDAIIWLLLVAGVGFFLISLTGLLLFPDTRSRMYTAVRASLIGISSVGIAVIIYGMNAVLTSGGNQYGTLILRMLILVVIVVAGNTVVYRIMLEKARLPVEKSGIKKI
jgi:multicomponent Na+:H+ antiporter subunit G